MTLLAEIALVALTAIGVAVCVSLLPDPMRTRLRRPSIPPATRPEQLVRLERLVVTSGASAVQAHASLRPLLAEIAARRLAARGQALERLSESAGEEMLGERLWDLVRPDRPFPENRQAPGVSAKDLARIIEALERL